MICYSTFGVKLIRQWAGFKSTEHIYFNWLNIPQFINSAIILINMNSYTNFDAEFGAKDSHSKSCYLHVFEQGFGAAFEIN